MAIAGCSLLVPLDDFSGGSEAPDAEANETGGGDDDASTDGPAEASEDDARASDGGRLPRIYVFGGTTDGVNFSEASSKSYYAQIQADGALGAWTAGPDLPVRLIWANAATGSDFVAMPGGLIDGSGSSRRVLIAQVTNGEVSGYLHSSNALADTADHAAVIHRNDTLYVLGDGTVADGGVQVGSVARSSVTPFRIAAELSPLRSMGYTSTAEAIYLVGGRSGSSAVATIFAGALSPDGGLGQFVAQPPLPTALVYPAAVAAGQSLFVLGGDNAGGKTSVLIYPIDASGQLGAYRVGRAMPEARSRHHALTYGNKIYVVGGLPVPPADGRDVYVGDIGTDGAIDAWRITSPLPTPLIFSAAALVY